MPSLNKVMLMGNLTRDPELRVTPKGTPICQFSLAINRQFKMESGESREEVIYVDVEAWGKQGETIAKYVTKGRPLYVEGRLRLDQWEDKNTKEKRSRMKVVLEQFQFLGDSRGGAGGGSAGNAEPGVDQTASPERYSPPPRSPAAKPAAQENLDEDVPF
ncbi:single-stranded DNA-binding protein [Opitutus sp. ER46]|uniref:single-stranded DNA-binding protein n=1 Tax=Opitutus sp. ER46 TaxID=2161864 RepID=UPI000D3139F5|nr:single-stranded DNA-binding protein [Opitutus sp. ER46]PTX96495.1 single-stranded DNA-binding protein [Opitutus sp. ER46]